MGKNKDMFTIFLKVMKNDKKTINLIMPRNYVKTIKDIDYKKLLNDGYKNLIFDIDNTIMPVNDINVSNELIEFFNNLKKDFNICLISNNKENRVNPVKNKLNVLAIANACKPSKYAYNESLKLLKAKSDNTVMIGDQMLSDIVFANRFNLYPILVEPFSNKYDIKTGTSRILQNILMKKLKDKIETSMDMLEELKR